MLRVSLGIVAGDLGYVLQVFFFLEGGWFSLLVLESQSAAALADESFPVSHVLMCFSCMLMNNQHTNNNSAQSINK